MEGFGQEVSKFRSNLVSYFSSCKLVYNTVRYQFIWSENSKFSFSSHIFFFILLQDTRILGFFFMRFLHCCVFVSFYEYCFLHVPALINVNFLPSPCQPLIPPSLVILNNPILFRTLVPKLGKILQLGVQQKKKNEKLKSYLGPLKKPLQACSDSFRWTFIFSLHECFEQRVCKLLDYRLLCHRPYDSDISTLPCLPCPTTKKIVAGNGSLTIVAGFGDIYFTPIVSK